METDEGFCDEASSCLRDCEVTPSKDIAILYSSDGENISTKLKECITDKCSVQPVLINATQCINNTTEKIQHMKAVITIITDVMCKEFFTLMCTVIKVTKAPYLMPILYGVDKDQVLDKLSEAGIEYTQHGFHQLQKNEDNNLHYSEDHMYEKISSIINGKCDFI